jgi:hypothetical protein
MATVQYHAAWQRVRRAVIKGVLPDLKKQEVMCIDCKVRRATVYDHRDYTKPLEVDPVCASCNILRGKGQNRHTPLGTKDNLLSITGKFTMMSFALRRDIWEQFRKMTPKFGERSQVLRLLVQMYVEGKIQPKKG